MKHSLTITICVDALHLKHYCESSRELISVVEFLSQSLVRCYISGCR